MPQEPSHQHRLAELNPTDDERAEKSDAADKRIWRLVVLVALLFATLVLWLNW